MKKAAAYCRYSSDNQREESIEAQLRAIKEYASKNEIIIVKIYADEARSATTDDRPQFLEMIKDAGNYDLILVHKLDRFARNRYDSAFYRKKLKDANARLVSILEPLDDSPESIILESVLEGMAEYYSRNLAREVKKGMHETALQARHNGGTPPLGYNVVNGEYVINETESHAVKKIYELYLDGYGYKNIAVELNKLGYRTKKGQEFVKNSIRDILLNEKYTGTYKHSEVRVENALPVIIPVEIYNKVQFKINQRKRGPRVDGNRYYLLVGLTQCGECGSAYSGNGYVYGRGKTKNYIYSCVGREKNKSCNNKNVRQDLLEAFVISELQELIFSDDAMDDIVNQILTELDKYNTDTETERKHLKSKIKEVEKKISKALDLLLDGLIDKETVSIKIDQLKTELNNYKERLAALDEVDKSWVDRKKIVKFLNASKENLMSDDLKVKRKIIETFVEKVVIYSDRIEVTYKFSISGKVGGGEPYLTFPLNIKRVDLYKKKFIC